MGKRPSHQWAGDVSSSGSAEAHYTVSMNNMYSYAQTISPWAKDRQVVPTEENLCLVVVENLGQIWDKLM